MPRIPGRRCFLSGGEGSCPGQWSPSCAPPGAERPRSGTGQPPSHPSGIRQQHHGVWGGFEGSVCLSSPLAPLVLILVILHPSEEGDGG